MERINSLAARAPLTLCVHSPRMELSERMYGEATLPEEVVELQFRRCMIHIENMHRGKTNDPIMKERVYSKVSGSYIESCRKQVIREVAKRIFGQFSSAETLEMIEEHKKLGAIHDLVKVRKITFLQKHHQRPISIAVLSAFQLQWNCFCQEVLEAFRDEGVELQEEKKPTTQKF